MKINIAEQLLPEVYNRHGKDCYLDPIRQKLIYITPEETVRQRMISYLVNELKVPKGAILVEEHLSHYNVPSKKRADIVVHGKKDETQYPVLIVECKAPDVFLDEKAHQQVFDYCNLINADYAIVCNGSILYCYKYMRCNLCSACCSNLCSVYDTGTFYGRRILILRIECTQ